MDNSRQKKVDSLYYDNYIYSDKNKVFTNFNSRFQKYRISHICHIYSPNKKEKVIDLGCGWGTFCFALGPLCKEIIGIDYSRKSIELCKRLLAHYGYKNVSFILGNARHTGLPPYAYDVIICADLFEHLYPSDFRDVLDECGRLLKPRGKLVIWTPFSGHIFEILKNNNILLKKDIAHVDYKLREEIIDELSKKRNFTIVKSYYEESHLPVFCYVEKILLPYIPLFRRRIAILAEKRD